MPRGSDSYNRDLREAAQQRADLENKRLNLALRGREKVFGDEGTPNSTLEGREARLRGMDSGNPCGPGYDWIKAPTSGGSRPRAYFACYSVDKEMEVMVIGMRDTVDKDKTMIQYDGVDPVLWEVLKNSDSTNDFINMYLDGHPWSRVSYQSLPRKRPDEFRFGADE